MVSASVMVTAAARQVGCPSGAGDSLPAGAGGVVVARTGVGVGVGAGVLEGEGAGVAVGVEERVGTGSGPALVDPLEHAVASPSSARAGSRAGRSTTRP